MLQVGDSSLGVIQVTNPSPNPVAVALLEPQSASTEVQTQRGQYGDQGNTHGFVPCSMCGPDGAFSGSVKCENCKISTGVPPRLGAGYAFRMSPGAVLAAVVQPMQTLRLGPIEFAPQKHREEHFEAVLPIRNNLTFVEMLDLKVRSRQQLRGAHLAPNLPLDAQQAGPQGTAQTRMPCLVTMTHTWC